MSYEDFIKAVKEAAVRMTEKAFDREEAVEKINSALEDLREDFGDNIFKDQFEEIQSAESKFSDGKMKEDIYRTRVSNAINTAAWNLWMLA